jgi:hypothetical protein
MNVNVFAGADVRDDLTDIFAVFDGRITRLEVLERDFVPQGNLLPRRKPERAAVIHADPHEIFSRPDVSYHDPYIVPMIVHQKVSHRDFSFLPDLIYNILL